MTGHARLVNAAGIYLLAAVFARLQFLVTLPIVSRELTPAEYGILTLANVVAIFVASTVQSTISGAVERFYADYDDEQRAECLGTIFSYLLILVAAMLVIALVAGPAVKRALLEADGYPFFPYFLVPVGTALLAVLNAFGTSLFRIEEKPGRVLAYSLLRFCGAVGAVYIAVGVLDGGLLGYLLALLLSELVVAAASLPYVFGRITMRLRTTYLREIVAFSLPLAPYVLLALGRDTGDRWILQHFVDIERIGIYGLGFGIAAGMNMVVGSLTVPYAATMMKRFPGRVEEEVERANLDWFRPAATQVLVLTLAAYAVFLLVVEDMVRLLTPAPFHEAWKPAALLGGVFVLRALYLIPHNVLQWIRRTGAIPLVTGAGLALGLPAIVLLAPHIGIASAPVGMAACYLVSWIACAFAVPRLGWLFPGDLRIVTVAAAACGLAGYAAANPPGSFALWVLLRVVAVAAVVAASYQWVYRGRRVARQVVAEGAARA